MSGQAIEDKRVQFDFEASFSNGGGIQGQGFRLDIEGEDIGDAELAAYIIQDLRLLMVAEVRILNKHIITERHKRSAVKVQPGASLQRFLDLSHTIEDGMITYKGLPAPIICDYLSREKSKGIYEEGTSFQIGKIEMVTNTGTYLDCPFHRFEHGKDLSQITLEQCAGLDAITINAKGDRNCTFNGRHSCVGRRRVRGRICGGVCREHTGSHCAGCPQEFASVRLFRSREMIVTCHWVDPPKVNSGATAAQVSDNRQ